MQLSRDYELLLEIERRATVMILQRVLSGSPATEELDRLYRIHTIADITRKLLLCHRETIEEYYDPEKQALLIPYCCYIPVKDKTCEEIVRKVEEYIAAVYEKIKEIASAGKN